MVLGSPWSPVGPEHPRAGLAGAGPSTTIPALPGDATNTPLCAQNMTLDSTVFTVFANDSDTGDASKVSYSIREVSTGLSPNIAGIALARTSVCWVWAARRMLGVPGPPQQALCQREDDVARPYEPGQTVASPLAELACSLAPRRGSCLLECTPKWGIPYPKPSPESSLWGRGAGGYK